MNIEPPLEYLNYLKTGSIVRHVRIISGDGDTTGYVWRIAAPRQCGALGIADIDHLETVSLISHIGVIARDGDVVGAARCIIAPCK